MDTASLLKNVLQLEIKKGFDNRAVVGGLDKFILNNIDKVPLKDTDKKEIRHLFSSYKSSPLHKRKEIVEKALNIVLKKPARKTEYEKFISISNTFMPVQYVKGIGPKNAQILKKLGIVEAYDLLYYFPRNYLDLSNAERIAELSANEQVTVKGKIIRVEEKRARVKLMIVTVTDGTGYLKAVWFNQPYLKDTFRNGQMVVFSGRVQYSYGRWEMPSPEYEIVQEGKELIHTMRIIPIYSLTQGISQKSLRTKIKNIIDIYASSLLDFIPEEIIKKYHFTSISDALKNIHFPDSFPALEKSKDRLIFDELFMLQIILGMRKKEIKSKRGIKFSASKKDTDEFEKLLPFTPTKGQENAMHEIMKDFLSGKPMNRLLHGDVGSGKTIVSLFALYLTVKNGFQGAMMSPTGILAHQTFKVAEQILGKIGIKIALLTSGTKKKERKEILDKVANGEIDILIGTHAIIQEDVEFKNLALNVVDEQHRFGVMQRGVLRKKAVLLPHTLVMSATPIPRTLALTLYGDLDISQIREMPKGRKPVATKVYANNFNAPYVMLVSEVKKGHRGYVVCPLVEESEKTELQSVQEKLKELKSTYLKNFRVG
ncbi:MAG: DEAD/DEAH box helicase, partial [Nitrospiraceae bacterium]|nr:DEAD/DEAH box helicase [Nitrospiraceae bacterium]